MLVPSFRIFNWRIVLVLLLSGAVLRAATPDAAQIHAHNLSLRDSRTVTTNYVGAEFSSQAKPLALASADFDGDGVPDLVSGYSSGSGGTITIHRGNVDALWPYGAALRNGEPPAFLPDARVFAVPEPPDFIGVGDFDADGHWDIVTAHLGGSSLYFLRGDGHGGFAAPVRVVLDGAITAFTTGEINRADGLTDIVVGVSTPRGAKAYVFESPMGALRGAPEVFSLPASASALALGTVEGGPMRDLAVAAGNQLLVVHGRDRRISAGGAAQASVAPAKITQQSLPFSIRALVLGRFSDTASLAALGDDGKIHLLQNANAVAQALRVADMPAAVPPGSSQSKVHMPASVAGLNDAARANHAALVQNLRGALAASRAEWTVEADVAVPASVANQTTSSVSTAIAPAHVSASRYDDLVLADSQANQVHVLSSQAVTTSVGTSAQTTAQPMSVAASLEVGGSPAAVLPMRLNQHGLQSLVVLHTGHLEPDEFAQAPDNTFTVTNTLDITTSSYTAPVPPGSLRQALLDVQNATGTSEIVFNIPTTDPGYNPATGVFLIQPLSQVPPNNQDDFALPPIGQTVTIDAYTQPGASPNTLAIGNNAKILIEINGGKALTPGGVGLETFDSVGAVIRGFAITGWGVSDNSMSTPTGGIGLAEGGISDYDEGNFLGVDATGTISKPNIEGVNLSNGPIIGAGPASNGGDILGGTTPQARNLISGNTEIGVLAQSGSYFSQIQGNYIGTDITGTQAIPNAEDGVFVPGEQVTVGGALPGAGNLISGNTQYNLSIGNGVPNGSASGDVAQGNLIGTDATGTKSLNNLASGVGIVNLASNITLGGTTPAARNVISGNNFHGVDLADNSSNVLIQGNYIGLDITGTKAVPNGIGAVTTGNNVPSSGISINTHTLLAPASGVLLPPFNNTIGGAVAGAGNVISGNNADGISIMGFDNSDPNNPNNLSNYVLGNFIGTDVTGVNALPNTQNGIYLTMDQEANSPAAHNTIGGDGIGAGNIISFNGGQGVLINGQSSNNLIVGNSIQSNGASGVQVASGTGNTITRNSIFGNQALGIELGTAGQNANSPCQANTTGGNSLQNAPVLTAGTGSAYITATATDPNGNTSEFSNAVQASLSGNLLSLLGNLNSLPSTTYTVEFFSNTVPGSSGFGQGQTYLTSTSVTTSSTCASPISTPVDVTQADISSTLSYTLGAGTPQYSELAGLTVGPDFGTQVYVAVVTNNGPATAHNVVLTDPLPASLKVSSMYCNLPSCQSPVTTSAGSCTVSANTVTCNLGTLTPGATATVNIPIQALSAGTITNTVNATATETDPNLSNNSASLNLNSQNPIPIVSSVIPLEIVPSGVLINTPSAPIIYGTGFLPNSTVNFTDPNGTTTTLPVAAFIDNQTCGGVFPVAAAFYCEGIQVQLPQSLVGTAGSATFTVLNPGVSINVPGAFTIGAACSLGAPFIEITEVGSDGTSGVADFALEMDVTPNVPSCTFTPSSSVPWLVPLNSPQFNSFGQLYVDFAVATNPGAQRMGNITVAGQSVTITEDAGSSSTCTYSLNPTSATLPAAAGNYSVQVTASSPSCNFTSESFAPWITVASASANPTGSATVNYSVTANTGGPQTGSLMIAGLAFPVTQNPATNCYFTLNPTSAVLPSNASTGSVAVTASQPSCAWTATTDSPSYVSITSGASGTGNGTIQYSVGANSGNARNPIISAGNQQGASAVLNISQASPFACTATLTPSTIEVPAEGASRGFTITPSFSSCSWTAVSNNPSDLTITSGATGTGNASAISFAVSQNLSGSPRTLTITAGCQTFTVTQDGAETSAAAATTLTYNGPVTFTNGSAGNPSAVLTQTTGGAPISGVSVLFTLGSGGTAQTCSGTTSGSGTATCTITSVNQTAGADTVSASFAGNTSFLTSMAGPVSVTITAAPAAATTLTYNGPVTFTNGSAGNPSAVLTQTTGGAPISGVSVLFTLGSGGTAQTCSGTTSGSGTATCTITSVNQTAGADTVSASFAGNTSFLTSMAGPVSVTIAAAPAAATTLTYNGPVTFTNGSAGNPSAVLTQTTGGAPISGVSVLFTLGSGGTAQTCSGTTSGSGTATCTITSVSQTAGADTVSASFAGNTSFLTSMAGPVSVTITAAPAAATTLTYNGPVTFTNGSAGNPSAVLTQTTGGSPVAGVSVLFTLGSGGTAQTCSGTTSGSGTATCTITSVNQTAGADTVSASFAGNTSFLTSMAGPVSVTITAAPAAATTLTYNGPVTFTNGSAGNPSAVLTQTTGGSPVAGVSVLFTLGSGGTAQTCSGTTSGSGTATCTITSVNQTAGADTVSASFAGNTSFLTSMAGPVSVTITAAPAAATTLTYNGPVTFTNGSAGNPSAVLTQTTGGAPISGVSVLFTLGSGGTAQTCSGTTSGSGTATCTITSVSQTAGADTVSASFAGNTSFLTSMAGPVSVTIAAAPAAATTLTYNGPVTFTNGSAGNPSAVLTQTTGGSPVAGVSVLFTLGSGGTAQTCSGTTSGSGTATCTITSVNQTAGADTVSASFAGNTSFLTSMAGPVSVTIAAAPAAATTLTYNGPVTFTNGSAGNPSAVLTQTTGGSPVAGVSVLFTLGSGGTAQTCSGTTSGSGTATCTITSVNQTAGADTVSASFAGNTSFLTSMAGPVSVTITAAPAAATTLTYNGPVTFTNGSAGNPSAVLTQTTGGSPVAGVSVLFTLGSGGTAQTCSGTTSGSGTATCTITSVSQTAGADTVSASFAGNTSFLTSMAGPITATIVDFTLSNATGSQNVAAGQPATFTITTASLGGTFPNSVTFAATGLPAGTTARFNPTSVTPGTSTTITLTTTARTAVATVTSSSPRGPSFLGTFPAWLASLALAALLAGVSFAGLKLKPMRRLAPLATLILLIVTAGYLAGCAEGGFPPGNSNGTPAGTYSIMVTGTSGTDVHSTTVTLIVQ